VSTGGKSEVESRKAGWVPISDFRFRELARAKVNLTLAVRGRRGDGYHELVTLATFAEIHDVVTLDAGAGEALTVSGPFAQSIDGENLLTRTLAALREADPRLRLGSVHLVKNLPVAAGIGGGSADAAALLRAVRRANEDRAADVAWMEIAIRLGADVPMCFVNRPALVWGKGETIAPLRHLPQVDAVIVNPRVPLATAGVFAALRSGSAPPTGAASDLPDLSDLEGMLDYMRAVGNDLERAALGLLPQIAEIKALLAAQTGCRFAAMSGSGPTCFGIFSSAVGAGRAASAVTASRPEWWVEHTVLAGTDAQSRGK
jgi:4-diphosphocytidyl-2-C-methyl-D-erythritol kinase